MVGRAQGWRSPWARLDCEKQPQAQPIMPPPYLANWSWLAGVGAVTNGQADALREPRRRRDGQAIMPKEEAARRNAGRILAVPQVAARHQHVAAGAFEAVMTSDQLVVGRRQEGNDVGFGQGCATKRFKYSTLTASRPWTD